MSEIDWSKAPEGAQYWRKSLERWYRVNGEYAYVFSAYNGRWDSSNEFNAKTIDESRDFVKRPSYLAWSGEGRPPVGTVCMVYPHNTLWGMQSTSGCKREILAYHGDFVWLGFDGAAQTTRIDKVDFRPIRTPEQIAAEEREKAICQMEVDSNWQGKGSNVFAALYDAGYRKTEG